MPNLDAKTLAIIGPHLRFGEKLGRFLSQIAPRRADSLNINYSGKVNEVDTTAITRAALKGFLQLAGGSEVNEVNAPAFAETLGLKVSESRLSAPGDYTDMLELSAVGEGKTVSVGGAFFGATPRIVSINSRPVEARPHGVVLVLENTDRPGMVGRVGTLLGDHGVNIATMSLSRNQAGGTAKLLMPGKDPGGCIITILLGIAGAFVGTRIGRIFAGENYVAGWIMSVVGAMILLLLYRLLFKRGA